MSKPIYSPEFKRKVVEEHLKGGKSVAAACREYRVGEVAFRRWREQYRVGENVSAQGQAGLGRELATAQRRIDELEGALGRATTCHASGSLMTNGIISLMASAREAWPMYPSIETPRAIGSGMIRVVELTLNWPLRVVSRFSGSTTCSSGTVAP